VLDVEVGAETSGAKFVDAGLSGVATAPELEGEGGSELPEGTLGDAGLSGVGLASELETEADTVSTRLASVDVKLSCVDDVLCSRRVVIAVTSVLTSDTVDIEVEVDDIVMVMGD